MVKKAKLCYMDTVSITVYTKTDYIYIGQTVETRIDTSNYELNGPIPKRKNNCN